MLSAEYVDSALRTQHSFMIPVKLMLKNFLCYGENVEPLDFTEFHVACLSGNNGHGKSALLDAITWTLWGEARKGPGQGKPDAGLLRLGTTDMQVEFEFDLEGDRYRVIRKYSKMKKSKPATLDLQVFDETTGNFKPIGGTKVGETENKIIKLLGMSYDTFINSAFILQGRADEFIQKGARDRKAILTEILGLSRYDELAKLAKSHVQETEKSCEHLQRTLEDMDKDLVHKETYRSRVEELEIQLNGLAHQLEERERDLEVLKEEKNLLLNKKHSLEDLNHQVQRLDSDLKILEKQIRDQQVQMEGYEQIIRRKGQILEDYQRYEKLRAGEGACTEKLQQLMRYKEEQNTLEQAIQKIRYELEKNKEKWEIKRTQTRTGIQEAESVLKKSIEIEQGYQELQKARREEEVWEDKQNQLEELEKKKRVVERQIEDAKSRLQAEIQALDNQAKELREKINLEFTQKTRLDQLQTRRSELETLEAKKERITERGNQLKVSIDTLKNRIEFLEQEITETSDKLQILNKSTQAHCPLCESDLDESKRRALQAKLTDGLSKNQHEKAGLENQKKAEENELSQLRREYKELEKQLQELPGIREDLARVLASYDEILSSKGKLLELGGKIEGLKEKLHKADYAPKAQAALKSLQEEIKNLGYHKETHQAVRRKIRDLTHFEVDRANLENRRVQHQKLCEALPEIEAEISKISNLLSQGQYAQLEQDKLAQVQAKIQALGYDRETHQRIQEELQKLHRAPTEKERLLQAEENINPVREALQNSEAARSTKENQRKDLHQKIEEFQQALEKLPQLEEAIRALENQVKAGKKEHDAKLQEQGIVQSKYHHCLELEEKKQELEAQLKVVRKEQFIYDKLLTAFGKDGIQALIIENAIPELEDEANAILSRLTDHRAHITIESLRDLKSGGIKETLDIRVSDELGTRDLEMYSGGESFRVNFALRIALSKLLAKRAGTKLRTLIIDEGFGTQDSQGLEQLIEAIKTIQDDFDKILIITHLEALKNAFPVRIEVIKFPDVGSSYQIIR